MKIWNGSLARGQQKTVPVRWLEEFEPPRQIQMKFSIKPYGKLLSAKSWEQIDHTAEEGATRRDDFACMLKIANKYSSSFRVQWRFWIGPNVSCRRCACNRRESSSVPKTVRRVEGPCNLSGWRGMAQSWNCWIQVSWFSWHVPELGRPRVWKLSR